MLLRVYALYASHFYLPSLCITCLLEPRASSLLRYATGAGQTHRDFDRTSPRTLDCSTSTTVTHHSYRLTTTIRGEGGAVGKARKAGYQLQHKGNDTAVYPIGRLRTSNLGPRPHASASHLFLIALMTLQSTPLPCRPVAIACISTVYPRRRTRRRPASGNARSVPPRNRWQTSRPIVPTENT